MRSRGLVRSVRRGALVLAVAMAVAGIRPLPARAADQIRIAIIDLNRVVNEVVKSMPEYRDYKIEREKKELEIERRRQEIEKLSRELEENQHLWSEDKVREARDSIREKRADLRYYAESVQRFVEAEEGKLVRRKLPDVREYLSQFGTREGYSIIMERVGLYYYNESLEITDRVIKDLTK